MSECLYVESCSAQWDESQMCLRVNLLICSCTQCSSHCVTTSGYSFIIGLLVTSSTTIGICIWVYSWISFILANHGEFVTNFRMLFWYRYRIGRLASGSPNPKAIDSCRVCIVLHPLENHYVRGGSSAPFAKCPNRLYHCFIMVKPIRIKNNKDLVRLNYL